MPAYRCGICALNWPCSGDYDPCPQCGGEVNRFGNVKAMSDDEAQSLKAHIDFEEFYEEWDATRSPERLDWKRDEANAAAEPR